MNDDHGELPYWKQDIMRKNNTHITSSFSQLL